MNDYFMSFITLYNNSEMGTVAGECSSCQSPSLGFYDSLKNRTILNNNTPEEEMLLKIYLNSQEEYN